MDKHVFVWRPPETDIPIFARAGRDAVERRLDGLVFARATVHVTDLEPPRFSLVPFRRDPMALVSLSGERAVLASAHAALAKLPGLVEAYVVDEAIPVQPHGTAKATLVTLFRRKPGLDEATFRRRWFEEHTPMAIAIHPMVGYVRNAVRSSSGFAMPGWDGIVTEDFADVRDVTTLRLFGRGPAALFHAARVGRHVSTFLDLATIETYLASPHVPT